MDRDLEGKSDLSGNEDDNLFESAENDCEEDVFLRGGMLSYEIPSKNSWSFESFSKRGDSYIGEMKLVVNSDISSFSLKYNLFYDIIMDKTKTETSGLLSYVRKVLFMSDRRQKLDAISCFTSVCPDNTFLSFWQCIREGLGDKSFKKEKFHLTFADWIEFFRYEIIMIAFEI